MLRLGRTPETEPGKRETPPVAFLVVCGFLAGAFPARAVEAAYRCADGTALTATFTGAPGGGSVALATRTTTTVLPQAMSAGGGRYASGRTQFWIKGREATFTRGGKATTCRTTSR